ncbi:hypothetical protein CEQ90_01280 [Lewinellaceae bacterium SD302]|nr:hypothetical protein CEQ90_01280 [Lewinellaceae bacterium SD302]
MKKVLFAFAALLLSFGVLSAQEAELKAASKAYDAFVINNDMAKLATAVENINTVMAGEITDPAAYIEAGNIYGAVMNHITLARTTPALVDTTTAINVEQPAVKAADAYIMAFNKYEKKGKKKSALTKLAALQGNLENAAIFAIQDSDYENAYANFAKTLEVHDFLKAQGKESYLDDGTKLMEDKFYAGYSALASEQFDEAKVIYEELVDADYQDANIYDGLYQIYINEGDKEKALSYLEQGRASFPDETRLLFAEINYYLGEKKLDVLLDKLQDAIAKEPENPSLYATLGSVNENLYEAARDAGNEEEAQKYFDDAKNWYEQALEKKPDYASAIYSIGALYFNRGAAMTQEQQKLSDDLSREGQKKYDMLGQQIATEFSAALPYFKRAEQMDPNDTNVLIALKEIFARQDKLDLSTEFKSRYEAVAAGETLKSYFANN